MGLRVLVNRKSWSAEEAEGLQEQEIIALLPFHEHAAQARRANVSQEVVMSRVAVCIIEVLEIMYHGVVVFRINDRT